MNAFLATSSGQVIPSHRPRGSGSVGRAQLLKRTTAMPAPPAAVADETALLLRVKVNRDEVAFDALFHALAPKVYGFLLRTGCLAADAENVVQDIMFAVWTKAALFDPARASARTWIYALARHSLIDMQRSRSREYNAFELYFLEHVEDATYEEDQYARAAGGKVAQLLEQLPEEQARVLLMTYVEGKSHREIARELALPVGTVKSRIRLGFQRMQSLMDQGR